MDVSDFPLTHALDCDVTVLAEVDSTNTYIRDHPGHPGRVTVVVTDNQTGGRGRLGRQWSQPPGSGLAVSVRLPLTGETSWVSAFPLLVGGVVAEVLGRHTGLVASVKWPNDVLVSGKKLAGVLCEVSDGAVVAGVGINLTYAEESLPTPQATSLHLHTDVDPTVPDRLVAGLVTGLIDVVDQASRGHLQTLLQAVSDTISTIGQRVKVDFPDQSSREGIATGLGPDGSLHIVWSDGTDGVVVAGDVWHLTPLA